MAKRPRKRCRLQITSIEPYMEVIPLPDPVHPNYCFLAVSGRSHKVKKLAGALVEHGGNPPKVEPGRVWNDGIHWVIGFTGLTIPQPDHPITYTLLVTQTDGKEGRNVSAKVQFYLLHPAASASGLGVLAPTILYPGDNEELCPTFTAYGTYSDAASKPEHAKMKLGDVEVWGVVSWPENEYWIAQFVDVPDNSGYKLYVYKNNTGDGSTSTDLHVDSVHCAPVDADDAPPLGGD